MHAKKDTEKTGKIWQKLLLIAALLAVAALCIWLHMTSLSDDGRIFPVRINEILASNTRYPNRDGRCCDYIELYNSADYPVDLTGFQLGDIDGNGRYKFPADTVMGPEEYLVVYFDKEAEGPFYGSFGISRAGGETYYLVASNDAFVDSVTTVPMDADEAMVRLGKEEWGLSSVPTPGENNDGSREEIIYNEGISPVCISEFSSANTGYLREYDLMCDWVELHNTSSQPADLSGFSLSDNPGNDKYIFPQGTVMEPGEYLAVYCSDKAPDGVAAPFSLSRKGEEQIVLKDSQGKIIEITDSLPMESGSAVLMEDGSWQITEEITPGFENSPQGYEAYLEKIGARKGSIVISEVMAGRQMILPDAFDEFSDWVELLNQGSEPVDLTGWFLSDDFVEPQKWKFPKTEIQPGERLLVFCSGRDICGEGELHTNFSLSAGGEELILSAYPGAAVDQVQFGEAPENTSYVFDSGNPALSEYPTPGCENTPEGYEEFCAASVPEGPLAIWEVMTYNDWYLPQALGECYDWAELKNISDQPVNLSEYCITDELENQTMHRLPDRDLNPGETFVVILSGDESLSGRYDHAGFSLNALSDSLLLYHDGDGLLDWVSLQKIPRGRSYGRLEDQGGFFYMDPTPGKPNTAGERLVSTMPVSAYAPGIYSGNEPFEISLKADGKIYYTTDGSEPTEESSLYEGPVRLEETAVLRAAAVENGKLSSDIYTATFIVGEPHELPVVSLVTDPSNLWGSKGIYKNGNMAIKYVKVPANVSYAGQDGSFSRNCEMSLHGATTVIAFNKKSFAVRFGDVNGGPLHYDVFGDGEVMDYRSLILRNSYESTYSTQMHDAFIGQFAAENCKSVLSQKYKYVALYLNGEYWGLYAIREKHSPEHYASHMGVPASAVTVCHYCTDGSNSLHDLYKVCGGGYLSTDKGYAYAKSVMDVNSLADWIILEAYMSNADIGGNMRYYYSSTDGLWRCGLVDADLGMSGSMETFTMVTDTWHHGKLMRAFLLNEEFQDLVATRLAELLRGPMSDENMLARMEEMTDTIRPEIELDNERWDYPPYGWSTFVNLMRDFIDGRARQMIDGFCQIACFTQSEREHYFGDLLS